jgi:hypothetical protein
VGAVAVAAFIFGVFWKACFGAEVIVILAERVVGVLLANCCRPAVAAGAWPLFACRRASAAASPAQPAPTRAVAVIGVALTLALRLAAFSAILVAGRLVRPVASPAFASRRRRILALPTAAAATSPAATPRPAFANVIVAARIGVASFVITLASSISR